MARTQLDDLNDEIRKQEKIIQNLGYGDYDAFKRAVNRRSILISIKINIQ